MGLTAPHTLLWLLTALTLTTQELVKLSVSPTVTAECGRQVTLSCNVSSSLRGLSITRMKWSRNQTSLCSVDEKGDITRHHKHTLSDFWCEYKHGQLSLIFREVQPLESGTSEPYMCKLQSNQGALHKYTTVELQECCGSVEKAWTSDGPTCTFKRVHPHGDVHWFHHSHNHPSRSRGNTTKQVDTGGWLTIHSYLKHKTSNVPYNCSLMSKSGRHIGCTLIHMSRSIASRLTTPVPNGVGSEGPMRTFLCFLILLVVTLK